MSDKLLKILLLSLVAIGLVVLGVVLVRAKNKKDALSIITNIENPFGISSEDVSVPGEANNNSSSSQDVGTSNEETPVTPIEFQTIEQNPIVRTLSDEPIAGATFVSVEREIPLPEEPAENLVEGYDFTGYPSLSFGADQKEVADLKTVLNRQNPSPALTIDNAFDTNLKNAVVDFQTRNNLTPDGVVGRGTYKALNDFQGIVPKPTRVPEKETVLMARFVDRANGYVYDKPVRLQESAVRMTNTTIPRVYEAYFSNAKDQVVLRFLKDTTIENFVGTIKKQTEAEKEEGAATALDTKPLSNKITFGSLLPGGAKFFFLTKEASGVSGSLYDFKTGTSKKVFSSSFSDWLPQAVNENLLSLTTRASGLVPGSSYLYDIKKNSLRALIQNVRGLTTNVSPDAKRLIYSSYENGALKTSLMSLATGQVSDFAPSTLPEKCVWTTDGLTMYCGGPGTVIPGVYPDDWYKGEILFTDSLWKIDVVNNVARIVLPAGRLPAQTDMTNLVLNDAGDYLLFTNKYDNRLYGVDLARINQ